MRVLIVSSVLPPLVYGGAEIAAMSLAGWLADETAMFTVGREASETGAEAGDGYGVFRAALPRVYHAADFAGQPRAKKLVWHLQDHFAPANRTAFGAVLGAFAPDVVNVQVLQGAGWNLLAELAARDVPTVLTLHDLGLACINMAMHQGGRDCTGHCLPCRLSTRIKQRWLERIPRLAVTAPSHAVVERLKASGALAGIPVQRIANVIRYPRPRSLPATPSPSPPGGKPIRLLFVGTIAEHKGVEVAIRAAAAAAAAQAVAAGPRPVTLDILGSGRALDQLRAEWAGAPWLRFHGQVPLQEVADRMAAADLLLVPSTGHENAPGVVIQARGLGLPILASAVGGIPELIADDVNGRLLPPGDQPAWSTAVAAFVNDPALRERLRAGAERTRDEFDPEAAGRQMLAVLEHVRNLPPRRGLPA